MNSSSKYIENIKFGFDVVGEGERVKQGYQGQSQYEYV